MHVGLGSNKFSSSSPAVGGQTVDPAPASQPPPDPTLAPLAVTGGKGRSLGADAASVDEHAK